MFRRGGHSMASGYLFRKFRELRGLTQKILGDKVNLGDVRIRQYELDMRNPKDDILEDISKALDVKPEYFKDPEYPYDYEEVMRLLFKLEDSIPMSISRSRFGTDGEYIHSLVFLGRNMWKIDHTLKSWMDMQNRFMDGEVTWEEYEDWKANWPDSADENYKFNRQNGASTSYKEYIDRVQKEEDIAARKETLAERRFRLAQDKIKREKKK